MKNLRILLTLIFFISILNGCSPIPPVDFTVKDVGMVTNRKNAELKSITVGFAPQSQQKVVKADATIPPVWKEGLLDALNRSLIFRDDAVTKINLSVRIVEFEIPSAGASMETKVGAIYEIIDRSNGDLIFSKLIESEGVVPFDYAFAGVTRSIESWNRAVRNNIADFIIDLEKSDFSKPIFKSAND